MRKYGSAVEDEDDENEKRKRIARDGSVLRVSMMAMDSLDPLQRAVALSAIDAAAHQPGYRFADASVQSIRDAVYLTHCTIASDAWRGPAQMVDRTPAVTPAAGRDAAYDSYVKQLSSAWQRR